MGRFISAEFLKLSKSLSYKILFYCMAGIGVLVSYSFSFMLIGFEVTGREMYLQLLCISDCRNAHHDSCKGIRRNKPGDLAAFNPYDFFICNRRYRYGRFLFRACCID